MIRPGATLGFVFASLSAAVAQTPASGPSSVPATAAASPAATASGSPVPLGPATPPPPPPATPPPGPVPTATPIYKFVYRPSPVPTPAPDPNTPQIAEIDLTDSTIVTPSDIHVRVLTSYAVTNVVAQTLGRSIVIPRTAPGLFTLDTRVPGIPFFMSYLKNQVYPIVFLASVPDGHTTSVTLPIILK